MNESLDLFVFFFLGWLFCCDLWRILWKSRTSQFKRIGMGSFLSFSLAKVLNARWRPVPEDNFLFWTGTNTVSEEYGYLQILSCGDEVLWAVLPPNIQAERIGALSLQNASHIGRICETCLSGTFNRMSSACAACDRKFIIVLVLVIVIESFVMVVPTGFFVWHHRSAKFPICSMGTCFNFSRCNKEQLLVYSYNDPAPLNPPTYFREFPDSQLQTSDPEKACLFFVYSDTETNENAWWWQKPHLQTLPFWNNGMNHVIITFADRWSETNPPPESIGMASVMSTALHHTAYRGGFDISIPLPRLQQQSPPELASVKPFQRKYFATFKGTRYLSREGAFRSSEAFRGMHNGKDVIVATTCRQETNDKLVRWQPWKANGCEADQGVYDSYDFVDLLNSTFAFVPAGRSPASYRFLEVLSAGAIPVLIADDYVRPFESLIQWERCLLQFSTHDLHRILQTLRSLPKEDVVDRQCYCQQVFASFLQDDSTLVRSVILSLQQRMRSWATTSLPTRPLSKMQLEKSISDCRLSSFLPSFLPRMSSHIILGDVYGDSLPDHEVLELGAELTI